MSCCPSDAAPYLAHEHDDKGKVGDADGVAYYQVGKGESGILLIPDVWGWNSGRTRALADEFATKGLSVWVPKILEAYEGGTDGDGLPPVFDLSVRGSELGPLLQGKWNVEVVIPMLQKVVAAMKKCGVKKFGVIGVCYGAWAGFHLSKLIPGNEMVCGVSPHPSVHIEGMLGGDPCELAKGCQCPWALYPCGDPASGGDGPIYDEDGGVFKNLEAKFPGKCKTKRFKDMKHGFVSRGAIKAGQTAMGDGDDVRKAVQECVDDMMAYFTKNGLLRTPEVITSYSRCSPLSFYSQSYSSIFRLETRAMSSAIVEPTTTTTGTDVIVEAPAISVMDTTESITATNVPFAVAQPVTAFSFVPTTYTQVASEPFLKYKPASKINHLTSHKIERPKEEHTRRLSVAAPQAAYSLPTAFSTAYSQPVFIMPPRVFYPTTTTTTITTITDSETNMTTSTQPKAETATKVATKKAKKVSKKKVACC